MQMDEKAFSDDDYDENSLKRTTSNNFMHQVHQHRKHSFSYSKQDESDSEISQSHHNEPDVAEYNGSFMGLGLAEQKYNKFDSTTQASYLQHAPSNRSNLLQRQRTEELLTSKSVKLERRHSADKVLCKPSTKNINSTDYLNRMVISLRSKITTYKEDLRIAGELGQKLFSQNASKDAAIDQYKNDIQKLRLENEELSIVKNQLLQTSQIDAEQTKRLEMDLQRQKTSHTDTTTKYEEQNIRLNEQLQHALSDVRHLTQLSEQQRLEIQTLETRNEQNVQNASETIDDLSAELAEEKDGHSNLKHKYSKLRNECTKLKIGFEKRGTEINNLKKSNQEKDVKILTLTAINDKDTQKANQQSDNNNKQQIKLLYRQINNYKDEMEGISKHLEHCKNYLRSTMDYLESTGLLNKSPFIPEDELNVDEIYKLCKNARQFLGIDEPPPDPAYPEESPDAPAPDLPRERSMEPLPTDDMLPNIPTMPREHTPEIQVSQREIQPLSVPVPPKLSTISPPPPSAPSQPTAPQQLPPPISPKHKPKIGHHPNLPPSIPSIPDEPSKPQISATLPPPRTPKQNPKQYNLGIMPQAINNAIPTLPAPAIPTQRENDLNAPSLPNNEVRSKSKYHSSAIQPPPKPKENVIFFPPPQQPQNIPNNIPSPPTPNKPDMMKTKINAIPDKPPEIVPPAPRTPSHNISELPPPRTPKMSAKQYNLGTMPQPINNNTTPSLPAPAIPTNRENDILIPSIPNEVRSKPKQFSSAIQPENITFIPPPQHPHYQQPPSIPNKPDDVRTAKINAVPHKPPEIAPPAPKTPKQKQFNNAPRIPSPRQAIPQSKTYNLGVMPCSVADEQPASSLISAPSIPKYTSFNNPPHSLPQEPENKAIVNISAAAMAPPSVPSMPSLPPSSSNNNINTLPQEREIEQFESMKSGLIQNNNKSKPPKKKSMSKQRKKKKSKKVKKERDTMEEQKKHLTVFFTTYSDNKNWEEGGKENGVQKYVLKFAEREPLNARMAFLYSMTLYLGQIVGVNKRCISHAFMLFKSVRAQIDTLCEEFALILQTLEHHNDDKLWKYVYSFLYNAAAYFKHIQRFVGTRCPVDNPKKYSRALKSGSRDYTNHTLNRRESSFRKLSGLSEVSGVSGISQQSMDFGDNNTTSNRRVYGSAGNAINANNSSSSLYSVKTSKSKKVSKKKRKKNVAQIE